MLEITDPNLANFEGKQYLDYRVKCCNEFSKYRGTILKLVAKTRQTDYTPKTNSVGQIIFGVLGNTELKKAVEALKKHAESVAKKLGREVNITVNSWNMDLDGKTAEKTKSTSESTKKETVPVKPTAQKVDETQLFKSFNENISLLLSKPMTNAAQRTEIMKDINSNLQKLNDDLELHAEYQNETYNISFAWSIVTRIGVDKSRRLIDTDNFKELLTKVYPRENYKIGDIFAQNKQAH